MILAIVCMKMATAVGIRVKVLRTKEITLFCCTIKRKLQLEWQILLELISEFTYFNIQEESNFI